MVIQQVTDGYPGYAASILASNDFFRSTSASVFPLFGTIFFVKLGLGPACSLLAGVSVILIIALYVRLFFSFFFASKFEASD
jgi:DHA1 family multidrug resistance protein-like MFS transporter